MNATTPRPFVSCSFEQLENHFKKAKRAGDAAVLRDLQHELTFRHRNRHTPGLAAQVVEALSSPQPVSRARAGRTAPATVPTPPTATPRAASRAPPQPPARAPPAPAPRSPSARQPAPPRPAPRGRTGLRPTDEQQLALDAFACGGSLKINAYAGAGKTSTLKLLASSTQRCGQYIAFNKAIVADTQGEFPATVDCSTLHSLAYRAIAPTYGGLPSKLTGRINANELAQAFDLKPQAFGPDLMLVPRSQAFLFLDTVRRFAQSAEAAILPEHVPPHGALRTAPPALLRAVQAHAVAGAQKLWGRMVSATDLMPLGHDGYLKLWALSQPLLGADFILLDEAQDTNPVVLGVLADQEAQMVYVGDKYQQIYEWRGAVNAMDTIQTDDTVQLTLSFRFGEAIADLASQVLRQLGATTPIQGNPKVLSRIGEVAPDAVLARSNASTMTAVIEALDSGLAPHLVGGTKDLKALLRGVVALKAGQPCDVPDFFGFANWEEVVEFARSEEGAHLLTFVNLVESLGERRLLWALSRTVDEDRADLMISTGHKAKGREWKSVRLLDDFLRSKPTVRDPDKPGPEPAELRLLYVALTRAKAGLEVPASLMAILDR